MSLPSLFLVSLALLAPPALPAPPPKPPIESGPCASA